MGEQNGGGAFERILGEVLEQPGRGRYTKREEAEAAVAERRRFLRLIEEQAGTAARVFQIAGHRTDDGHSLSGRILSSVLRAAPYLGGGERGLLELACRKLDAADDAQVANGTLQRDLGALQKELRAGALRGALAEMDGDGGRAMEAFLEGLDQADRRNMLAGVVAMSLRMTRDAERQKRLLAVRQTLVAFALREAFYLIVTVEGDRLRRNTRSEQLAEWREELLKNLVLKASGLSDLWEMLAILFSFRRANRGTEGELLARLKAAREIEQFGRAYSTTLRAWRSAAMVASADLDRALAGLEAPLPIRAPQPKSAGNIFEPDYTGFRMWLQLREQAGVGEQGETLWKPTLEEFREWRQSQGQRDVGEPDGPRWTPTMEAFRAWQRSREQPGAVEQGRAPSGDAGAQCPGEEPCSKPPETSSKST